MLAPCRVMLTEPDAGLLPRRAPLTTPMSCGSRAAMLLARPPAVIDTRPSLLDACDATQSADVCDTQDDASQALWLNRHEAECSTWAPSTTTCSAIEAAAAALVACARLRPTLSADQTPDTLPNDPPVVAPRRMLPASHGPVRHTSSVSELHVVASQTVDPASADGLASIRPSPSPSTVTLAAPVPAVLTALPPPTLAVSPEITPVPLPT